jgi:hypothetical protein
LTSAARPSSEGDQRRSRLVTPVRPGNNDSSTSSGNSSIAVAGIIQPGFTAPSAPAEPPRSPGALPLVFHDLPPEVAADPQKVSVAQLLQQSFVDAIGGLNQDPTDPAYLDRWASAQRISDEQFRLRFGAQAFLAAQISANRQ